MEGRRFTTVIDLTQKAQRERKQEQDVKAMAEPENALPPARISKLPEKVQSAISAAGWNRLMPVQERTIPYLLARRDVIVQSRTGSGKTGAFLLPIFELLNPERSETQALILTPTRELARQIYEEFERMKLATPETNDLRGALIYGGVKYAPQIRSLKRGAHVVIGTPGRILDHLEKGVFSLQGLNVLIFDEADEMLSMGFYPAMRQLKRYLPRKRLSCMFSATIPAKVRSLSQEFLHEPSFLSLSGTQVSVETIEHRYYVVNAMEKDRAVVRIIEMENPDSAIIFSNTKREVEYLSKFLRNYGYDAAEISGDLSQQAREEVMDKIRRGELRFLVATDVAARGIDISDLTHVIMYDVPQDPEYYVHRAGRTARAGKTGTAIVFAGNVAEERNLLSITNRYGIEIQKMPLPDQKEVEARVAQRMTVILESMMRERTNLERERLQRFVPLVSDLAKEEPELLAMLIDSIYMKQLHSPPETIEAEQPRRQGRPQQPRREEPSEARQPSETAAEEQAPRKKKKRKKKKRGRGNREGEAMQAGGEQLSPAEAQAEAASVAADPAVAPEAGTPAPQDAGAPAPPKREGRGRGGRRRGERKEPSVDPAAVSLEQPEGVAPEATPPVAQAPEAAEVEAPEKPRSRRGKAKAAAAAQEEASPAPPVPEADAGPNLVTEAPPQEAPAKPKRKPAKKKTAAPKPEAETPAAPESTGDAPAAPAKPKRSKRKPAGAQPESDAPQEGEQPA